MVHTSFWFMLIMLIYWGVGVGVLHIVKKEKKKNLG